MSYCCWRTPEKTCLLEAENRETMLYWLQQLQLRRKQFYKLSINYSHTQVSRTHGYRWHTGITDTQVSLTHGCHWHAGVTDTRVSLTRRYHWHRCHWHNTQVLLTRGCHWRAGVTDTRVSLTRGCHWHAGVTDTQVSLMMNIPIPFLIPDPILHLPVNQCFTFTVMLQVDLVVLLRTPSPRTFVIDFKFFFLTLCNHHVTMSPCHRVTMSPCHRVHQLL